MVLTCRAPFGRRLGTTSVIWPARGTNTVEQGNRAATPAGLAKSVTIASLGAGAPVAPTIDWNGRLGDQGPNPASTSSWLESFVNALAGTSSDPNSRIRIKL